MTDTPQGHFGLSCPSGGDFYICDKAETEFIGCCTSDPCSNKGKCPVKDLRDATFSADSYDDLATQDCDNVNGTKIWFTCKFNKPPFLGCCSENPCGLGECPLDSLVPAKLSSNANNRQAFLEPSGTHTAGASSTADSTASSTASGTSAAATATESSDSSSGGLSTGAVAGIAVGATAIGLIALALLFWRCFWVPKKKKQGEQMRQVAPDHYQPQTPGTGTFGPQLSPHSGYNQSLASTPTAVYYPSGTPQDMQKYGWSPQPGQQFSRHDSYNYTDASGMTPHMQQHAYNSPQMHHPPQEMDATTTAPIEMATGHEDQFQHQQDPNRSPGHNQNQLGIRS
ncbi:Fc.00g083600.m01.CDS01 [Cosmosporella sp. VM-42]